METILKILFFLWGIASLHSCQDENVHEMQAKDLKESISTDDNPAFLVFSSKEDLKKAIDMMKSGMSTTSVKKVQSIKVRSVEMVETGCSDSKFQSLIDAQKQLCLSKFTQEQLDSINGSTDIVRG